MNFKLLILSSVFFISAPNWHYSLEEAEKIARKDNKYILLNFSGSDWCGPCIRMQKEIFESKPFIKMADNELVLVNADFPRKKKNQLPAGQQKINEEIADKYNEKGIFPYTVLMNANGKVILSWEGFPNESPETFILEVRNGMYSKKPQ